MIYMITTTDRHNWEQTTATTLRGAKRLASIEYQGGMIDAVIKVGIKHDTGDLQILASKSNRDGKWHDLE